MSDKVQTVQRWNRKTMMRRTWRCWNFEFGTLFPLKPEGTIKKKKKKKKTNGWERGKLSVTMQTLYIAKNTSKDSHLQWFARGPALQMIIWQYAEQRTPKCKWQWWDEWQSMECMFHENNDNTAASTMQPYAWTFNITLSTLVICVQEPFTDESSSLRSFSLFIIIQLVGGFGSIFGDGGSLNLAPA